MAVAVALLAGALVLAHVLRRRRPDAPVPTSWAVPTWVERLDFDSPQVPWLVAVFTSATCRSCRDTMDKAASLACDEVVVAEVEVSARPELHERYGIEAVPTLVIADAEGAVRGSFVGPPTAAELWARVAEARDAADGDVIDPGDDGAR